MTAQLADAAATTQTMTKPAWPTACVILAAGQGKRMASALPKTLHAVGGRSMLAHALAGAASLEARHRIVVVGVGADRVASAATTIDPGVETVVQAEQRGTGHATLEARDALAGGGAFEGDVFVLYGDTPLIRPETLATMAAARRDGADVVVLGFEAAVPGGYGRLILGADGGLDRIVEAKDATEAERAVTFCNSGVMCVDGARLFAWLDRVDDDNAAGEIYLTDVVAIARQDGASCAAVRAPEDEVLGVNSRAELARAEAAFQARARAEAMAGGVTLIAPETVFFAYDTTLGRDVIIEPNVTFGPGVVVADDVQVRSFCHLEGCRIGAGAVIGPFARLRPGADLGQSTRIGNFVEVKNATLGDGAKANHLSYVGDAQVGAGANIGAGTITCNYDGYLKHQTEIGAGAFIGSNTALVAPVTVGAGAIVGAGSTITATVEDDALAIARGRQETMPGKGAALRVALSAKAEAAKKSKG